MGAPVAAVVQLIHEAGGIASLAHPGPNGRDHLIPELAANGLDALEATHSDHDAATEAKYRRLAAALGLAVTGGSDFHSETTTHRVSKLGVVTLPADDLALLRRRHARR